MNYLCFNGEMIAAGQPVLTADNRGFRYGEGIFETMKLVKETIPLQAYHFQRLFEGLAILQLKPPDRFVKEELLHQAVALCRLNHCTELARVRLTVFGGSIGENEDRLQYIIESRPADPAVNRLNEEGCTLGLYPYARKSCDIFSQLKSANYLPFLAAAKYAKSTGADDCLVLNMYDRIAEASIANVFLVKGSNIITPPLNEGCVAGVMRRYLAGQLQHSAYDLREEPVSPGDVELADEVFLTNAVYGMRWVQQFRDKRYSNTITRKIYDAFVKPMGE